MIATGLVALVCLIHVAILLMEMVLWETARVRAIFRTTPEFAAASRILAANQGLYNGFLAAGLALALIHGLPGAGEELAEFILGRSFILRDDDMRHAGNVGPPRQHALPGREAVTGHVIFRPVE